MPGQRFYSRCLGKLTDHVSCKIFRDVYQVVSGVLASEKLARKNDFLCYSKHLVRKIRKPQGQFQYKYLSLKPRVYLVSI